MIKKLTALFKAHPVALILFIIYIGIWLTFCYLTYYYLAVNDSEIIEDVVFYTFTFAFIPYLAANIWIASFGETQSSFYKELCFFIAIPMLLVVAIYIAHEVIAYTNSGV
jgi:hypothetical protein